MFFRARGRLEAEWGSTPQQILEKLQGCGALGGSSTTGRGFGIFILSQAHPPLSVPPGTVPSLPQSPVEKSWMVVQGSMGCLGGGLGTCGSFQGT